MSKLGEVQEYVHECGVVTGGSMMFDRRSYPLGVGELVVAHGFDLLALAQPI